MTNPTLPSHQPKQFRNPGGFLSGRRSRFGLRISRSGFLALLASLSLSHSAADPGLSPDTLAGISFEQKLGQQISLDLPFRDEEGKAIRLRDYFGEKPVIVVLGYYECPMLCTIVLNGLVESLQELKWSIGQEFAVVSVSINPGETPVLASAKKRTYLKRYGRASAAQGWHFLTGDEPTIKKLADQVGFHYAYDSSAGQYAHPSGFVVLTPEGKVARYFFGASQAPKEVSAALTAASAHQVGSPIQQLLLLCFHYNPVTGKFSLRIMNLLRLLGVATVLALGGGIVLMARPGNQTGRKPATANHAEATRHSTSPSSLHRDAPKL